MCDRFPVPDPTVNGNIEVPGKLNGVIGASILILAGVCYGTDQGTHSCRDDSIVVTKGVARAVQKDASASSNPKAPGSGQHSVLLSWKAPAGVVKGYIIERKESSEPDYNTLSLVPIRETSCTDDKVLAGHTYIYQARSVGISGRASGPSNQAKAIIPNP